MGHGFFACGEGFFGTRIGWMGHGSFACGEGFFWNTDLTDGTRIFCLRRGIFLEHGFDGLDTDLLPPAWIFGTRIGWMEHGSFAFGGGIFWNTDWMDETRIFCLRLRFFGTRI